MMTNEEFLGMDFPELDELMGMMPPGTKTDMLVTLSRKSFEAGQNTARRDKCGEWHYPRQKEWPEPGRQILMHTGEWLVLGWYDGMRWGDDRDEEIPEPDAWQYPEIPAREATPPSEVAEGKRDGEKRRCPATGKICYSRREAGSILNYPKRNKFGRNIPKRSFYCEECGTWHLTHLSSFGGKRKKKRIRRIR